MSKISGVFLTLLLALCAAELPAQLAQKLLNVQNRDWHQKASRLGTAADDSVSLEVDDLSVTFVGTKMTATEGNFISAFQGIKYAEFPQRFKHSTVVPKDFYSQQGKTVTADKIAEKCTQKGQFDEEVSGQEDCLYLNVYLPFNAETEDVTKKSLPVIVFIHGGNFVSGDSTPYSPTLLLNHDVILVTIHYRLGALGWLAAESEEMPGNAGLSDQMNSLRWVNNYIEGFGGDPTKVTVYGEDAGAISASLIQTVASKDENLFAGVIAESGSALDYRAIDPSPVRSFMDFADICGCTVDANTCLTIEKSDTDIAECTYNMMMEEINSGKVPMMAISPVVQNSRLTPNSNVLISKPPLEYILAGEAVDVPVLMGANKDEGSFVLADMYLNYLKPHGYDENGEYLNLRLVPEILKSLGISDPTDALAESLKTAFIDSAYIQTFNESAPGIIDMLGSLFFKSGPYQTALYHSKLQDSETFFYSFEFESENTVFDDAFDSDALPFDGGVTHGDELQYIFPLISQYTDDVKQTSDRLTTLWTNFATSQDPTPEGKIDDLNLPKWAPLDESDPEFLLVQEDVTMQTEYRRRFHVERNIAAGNDPTADPGVVPDSSDTTSATTTTSTSATTTTSTSATTTTSTSATTTTSKSATTAKKELAGVRNALPVKDITHSSTTTSPVTTTTSGPTDDPCADYDTIKKQRQSYMIAMIIFIILFVAVVCGAGGYYWFKLRK